MLLSRGLHGRDQLLPVLVQRLDESLSERLHACRYGLRHTLVRVLLTLLQPREVCPQYLILRPRLLQLPGKSFQALC